MLEFIPALYRSVHSVQLLLDEEGIEVTHSEALVLALLAEAGPQRMIAIHRAFGHKKSTLRNVVDRLAERRLVSRRDDPEDPRHLRVSLTRAGERAAKRIVAVFTAAEKRALAAAQPCDPKALRRGLEALGDTAPRTRSRTS